MMRDPNDTETLLNSSNNEKNSFQDYFNEPNTHFENHIQNIQGRQNKGRATEPTKSALHFSIKNPSQPVSTRSDIFRGDFNNETVMCKYTVFWTNKRQDNKLYKIIVELPHLETVSEAVRDIIPYFNQQLAEENSNYTLSPDPNLYEFMKAKKSGLPRTDYPALDANQIISQTGIQKLCLVETTTRAIIQKNLSVLTDQSPVSKQQQQPKTPMLSPVMPDTKSKTTIQSISEEEYTQETYCLCFTSKKKSTKPNKDGLKTSLLGEF